MGSGLSSRPTPSASSRAQQHPVSHLRHDPNRISVMPVGSPVSNDKTEGGPHMLRTNQVAPIIIRNCREEFQHVSDFKDPVVYGCIADGMVQHALIRNQYFMVNDVNSKTDRLGTMETYHTPNVRCAKGFPIYGCGQPSKRGLHKILNRLEEDGNDDIIMFLLREEPVLYVDTGDDMVTYSLRHGDNLDECLVNRGKKPAESELFEVVVRKEIIDLACLKHDNRFYFYDDLDKLADEPHEFNVEFADNVSVSEEIFRRPCFKRSNLRYKRICVPVDSAPLEEEFDSFVQVFKETPSVFMAEDSLPAIILMDHTGIGRAHTGMVMSYLIYCQRNGFPGRKEDLYPSSKTEKLKRGHSRSERGDFVAVQLLVDSLRNGHAVKAEVDAVIDICSEAGNIRNEIYESKTALEGLKVDYVIQGGSAREYYLKKCIAQLERYFYLICFNAYLHDEYPTMFSESFSKWMKMHPELYRLLGHLNVCERRAPPSLLTKETRFLVMDDYIGLDVLSSHQDVQVSNFRKMPLLPIYGMAQPSSQGISKVLQYLTHKKQSHPFIAFFNLREDIVLECDGVTCGVRDITNLEGAINLHGINQNEIEDLENEYKNEVISNRKLFVYKELHTAKVPLEIDSVLTPLEMFEEQRPKFTPEMAYFRLPMHNDCSPEEKVYDMLVTILNNFDNLEVPDESPALVFHCRTGKGRTITAMAIAGLFLFHKRGFPYGTKPGEQERISVPNAQYTKGDFQVVQTLVRILPDGHQVKREVDFILDQISETMTPMHYHAREIIFVTYNKMKKARSTKERFILKRRSIDYLERYIYLILFNAYLHSEKDTTWDRSFSSWMKQVAAPHGVYDILDNVAFTEFEEKPCDMRHIRVRWRDKTIPQGFQGKFI
ncbi:paladin-like isoform X2 [Lineus longissimus]|uniref:paladin-like isoform X2 n=1 Tax=Lineus longissimus TaxID=88925 RepID=UPI00315C5338